MSEDYKLLLGDFREVGKQIPDNSIDMIFTDFPYEKESIDLLEDFALFCVRVLKEGRSLLVFTGHWYLTTFFAVLTKHLQYHWLLTILMQKHTSIYSRHIMTKTHPLLWFSKGVSEHEYVVDTLKSKYKEKTHHCWEKQPDEYTYYLERLTKETETILDPFMGSATSGVTALSLNRKFIGIEINPETFKIAEKRILESRNYQITNFIE